MTEKEYLEILNAMDKAEESVVPFPVPGQEEITIVGDPNLTQTNSHDFKIMFRVPRKGEDGKIHYDRREVEYKDVVITGRNDPKIIKAMSDLLPFYKKVNENGGIEKYSVEEKLNLVTSFSDEIVDRLYNVVAAVLNVDERLKNYMEYTSVIDAVSKIFKQYPEMVNESSTFFH